MTGTNTAQTDDSINSDTHRFFSFSFSFSLSFFLSPPVSIYGLRYPFRSTVSDLFFFFPCRRFFIHFLFFIITLLEYATFSFSLLLLYGGGCFSFIFGLVLRSKGRKEGRKGGKEERKEGRKEGRKGVGTYFSFFLHTLSFFPLFFFFPFSLSHFSLPFCYLWWERYHKYNLFFWSYLYRLPYRYPMRMGERQK